MLSVLSPMPHKRCYAVTVHREPSAVLPQTLDEVAFTRLRRLLGAPAARSRKEVAKIDTTFLDSFVLQYALSCGEQVHDVCNRTTTDRQHVFALGPSHCLNSLRVFAGGSGALSPVLLFHPPPIGPIFLSGELSPELTYLFSVLQFVADGEVSCGGARNGGAWQSDKTMAKPPAPVAPGCASSFTRYGANRDAAGTTTHRAAH
jgi:hypothetical protein